MLSPRWSVAAGPRSRDTGSTVKQTAVNVSFTEGVGAMKTTSRRYKNVKGDANENCVSFSSLLLSNIQSIYDTDAFDNSMFYELINGQRYFFVK